MIRITRSTISIALCLSVLALSLAATTGRNLAQQKDAKDKKCEASDLTENPRKHPRYLGLAPGEKPPKPMPGCSTIDPTKLDPCDWKILELLGTTGTVDGKELTVLSAYWDGAYVDFEISNFPALEYDWAGDPNFSGNYSNVSRITSAQLFYKDGTTKTVSVYNKVVRVSTREFCKLAKPPTVSELLSMGA